jgi:polar amino acid transport system permease protein
MASSCADPSLLEGLAWLSCYLMTGKHMAFYLSFLTVLILLAITAPVAIVFGLLGAVGSRARLLPVRLLGRGYISIVRGVPDIVFFLFVPIALDQGFEYLRHRIMCPDVLEPVRQGNDFVVCTIAKLPLNSDPQWLHEIYGFALAVLSFAIVFGAFAGNTFRGAFEAVPRNQLETAEAYGMNRLQVFWRVLLPQMWIYALPGLSNLWMILIKVTPLLFLLGVEDIVYWARELGSAKTSAFTFPHPDWRLWYFMVLLLFYLGLTRISEIVFSRLMSRYNMGQATLGGNRQAGQIGR